MLPHPREDQQIAVVERFVERETALRVENAESSRRTKRQRRHFVACENGLVVSAEEVTAATQDTVQICVLLTSSNNKLAYRYTHISFRIYVYIYVSICMTLCIYYGHTSDGRTAVGHVPMACKRGVVIVVHVNIHGVESGPCHTRGRCHCCRQDRWERKRVERVSRVTVSEM